MRILITTDLYLTENGITTSVNSLKSALEAKGHEVRLLTLSLSSESYRKHSNYFVGSVCAVKATNDRISFKLFTRFLPEIIQWNPDIIHAQTEFSTYLMAKTIKRRLNIPIINTCHALYKDYIKYVFPVESLGESIVKVFSQHIYSSASLLVVPTDKVKKIMRSYKVKKPITVVPTGINLSTHNKLLCSRERNEILSDLKIPLDSRILVTVSRMGAEKNIDEILYYMKGLTKKNKKICFVIVGDGAHKKSLENKVFGLGLTKNVYFTGMIDHSEIYKYYQLGAMSLS